MPAIGSFCQSVYREESRNTGDLVAAVCSAQMEFGPIALDSEGTRNGQTYRYASIKSIRRAITPALCKHGLLCNHVYSTAGDGCEVVCTVLRHVSGEYMSSVLRIPHIDNVQDSKAAKTLLCRTSIEGLLGIVTEDDDDGAGAGETSAVDAETKAVHESNMAMASTAIARASSEKKLTDLLALVATRMTEGVLPSDAADRLKPLIEKRKGELNADAA